MTSWYVSHVLLIFIFFIYFFSKIAGICKTSLFPSNWIESGQLLQKLLEWGDWHTEG